MSDERRDEIERKFSIAQEEWKPREFTGEDNLDEILTKTGKEIQDKKDYISTCSCGWHPVGILS